MIRNIGRTPHAVGARGSAACQDVSRLACLLAIAAVAFALAAVRPGYAQEPDAAPRRPPSVVAVRTLDPPVIDGSLGDTAWSQAAIASDFWVVDQQRAPSERTEVLVLADDDRLYFGFRVFDGQPDAIEARQTRRDAGMAFDDQITVELDTFRNARDISKFSVNALGTQRDEIAGGRARKIGWKGDWRAAAVRTSYGWSAEIAIPFAMLNYPDPIGAFGINFVRYHNRTGERSYWADVTPQFKPELMGVLASIEPPRAEGAKWAFMPYVLAGVNAPDKQGKIRDSVVSAGADIRWQPRRDATGVVSLNPDFSQLEAQFASINFSYTEKAVLDPRPFFLEGARYFDAGRGDLYFYSNRVPDFDAGARFFGRATKTQFGGFAVTAPDDRQDYAMRVLQELDATNSAALSFYATRRAQLDNSVVVGQFNGRQPSGFSYSADLASSDTSGTLSSGAHGRGQVGFNADYWWVSAEADQYDRTFFPANGLLPGDLPGTRGGSASAGYYRVYAGPVYALSGDVSLTGRDTLDGLLQRRYLNLGGYVELRNQIRAGLYYTDGKYRPVSAEPGVFSGTVNDDAYGTLTLDFSTRSSRLGYGVAYSNGYLGGGPYQYLPAYIWIRPRRDLYFSLTAEWLDSFGTFSQAIAVAKWDITPSDAVGGRVVTSDGEQYYRLTYGRQVRSGVDVFAVIDHQPNLDTQFSVKLLFTFP